MILTKFFTGALLMILALTTFTTAEIRTTALTTEINKIREVLTQLSEGVEKNGHNVISDVHRAEVKDWFRLMIEDSGVEATLNDIKAVKPEDLSEIATWTGQAAKYVKGELDKIDLEPAAMWIEQAVQDIKAEIDKIDLTAVINLICGAAKDTQDALNNMNGTDFTRWRK